ncbi:MAG TPA: EAL domain-containing protein [Gammaproteobacteria bacterium]|nr:EAL domain-containing protein [Gammaproteobacteria bacterium]
MGRRRAAAPTKITRGSLQESRSSKLAEQRLQSVIELTADCYWEQGVDHRFTLYRPSGAPDADLETLVGKTSWEVSPEPPEGGWEPFRALLRQRAPFRDVLHRVASATKGTRYVSFSGQPVFDERKAFRGYRGVARDVSAEIWGTTLIQLENVVARVLTEADNVEDGLRRVLEAMCSSQQWTVGNFWRVDELRDALHLVVGWCTPQGEQSSLIAEGDRLPPWLTGGPVWIGDVAREPSTGRLERVAGPGWNTALMVPVKAGQATVGVLEFCAPRVAAPDPQFLRVLRTTSSEIAHFYQRSVAIEKLRESEERFSSTMELAAIGIAHVGNGGRFIYVNPQLCAMLGYTEQELLSMTVRDVSHPGDMTLTDESGDKLRAGEIRSFKMEKRYLRKDGTPVWVGLTIASKRDRDGEYRYDISVVEDISARKGAEERIQYLATHDGLTGLPNRVMFGQILQLAIETARRYDRKLAVLFIDLDRFKIINDTLGHEAGDVLLREMAARLRECLRASDVVARLGGDEFVVLLQEINEPEQAATVARNILSVVMKPLVILGQECRVTASIGICMHPGGGQDDHAVMKNADMAMYLAKEDGKNTFKFFSDQLKPQSVERLKLETNLRRALERDEFALHYQAKVNFKTGAITGVEALLRWQNAELGSVSPARFIPLAEETGLIVPIGKWVLRTACTQSVAWREQGLPPVSMSVNLSLRQLNDERLVPEIQAVLEETGMDPSLLELEVTESSIMQNAGRAAEILTAIKRLGVRLAIDDFGTGYSSLSHLKRFPIDTLKVDRSFIREVPNDAEDKAIAEAIIAMGKTLSLTVVAEGVETPQQQAFLSEKLCDEMQGYYFSTPVAAQDFAELLRSHAPKPLR